MYNKNQFKKTNAKKILHKVGKSWKVISLALLLAIGGGAAVAHADNTSATMTNLEPSDYDTEAMTTDNVDMPMSYENTNFQQPENDTGTFTVTPNSDASANSVSSASASSAPSASLVPSSASTNFVINNNIPHDNTVNNDDDINNNDVRTVSYYYVKPQKPASSASASSKSSSYSSDQHPVVIPPIKSDANIIGNFRDTRTIIHLNMPPEKPLVMSYEVVVSNGFNYNSSEINNDEANLTNDLYTNPMSFISPAFTAQDVYDKAVKDMKNNDSKGQVISDLDGTFMENGYYTVPSSVDQSIYNGLNNYSSSIANQSADMIMSSDYNSMAKSLNAETSEAHRVVMPSKNTTFYPDVCGTMVYPDVDSVDASHNFNDVGKQAYNDFEDTSEKCHLGLNRINGHYYWIKDLHNSITLPGMSLVLYGKELPSYRWRTGADLDVFALKHPATNLNFNNIIDGIGLLHSGNALDNADYADFQQGHPIKFDRSTGNEVSPSSNDTNTINGYGIMSFNQPNIE